MSVRGDDSPLFPRLLGGLTWMDVKCRGNAEHFPVLSVTLSWAPGVAVRMEGAVWERLALVPSTLLLEAS